MEHNSVLFVCGYSFGDEHINNVIYRALAVNASLNVVVLNDLKDAHPLRKTEDTRVYNIWSKTPEGVKDEGGHIHYFSEVVEKLLTDLDLDSNDTVLDKFVKEFFGYIRGNKQKQ